MLGRRPVTVIGTERGRNTKDRVARNFGSAHPEGYRKALRLMREARNLAVRLFVSLIRRVPTVALAPRSAVKAKLLQAISWQ